MTTPLTTCPTPSSNENRDTLSSIPLKPPTIRCPLPTPIEIANGAHVVLPDLTELLALEDARLDAILCAAGITSQHNEAPTLFDDPFFASLYTNRVREAELLELASKNVSEKEIRTLIAACHNVNARDIHGKTALIHAAEHSNLLLAQCLMEAHADPTLTSNDGASALTISCKRNNVAMMRILTRLHATPPSLWPGESSALHVALAAGFSFHVASHSDLSNLYLCDAQNRTLIHALAVSPHKHLLQNHIQAQENCRELLQKASKTECLPDFFTLCERSIPLLTAISRKERGAKTKYYKLIDNFKVKHKITPQIANKLLNTIVSSPLFDRNELHFFLLLSLDASVLIHITSCNDQAMGLRFASLAISTQIHLQHASTTLAKIDLNAMSGTQEHANFWDTLNTQLGLKNGYLKIMQLLGVLPPLTGRLRATALHLLCQAKSPLSQHLTKWFSNSEICWKTSTLEHGSLFRRIFNIPLLSEVSAQDYQKLADNFWRQYDSSAQAAEVDQLFSSAPDATIAALFAATPEEAWPETWKRVQRYQNTTLSIRTRLLVAATFLQKPTFHQNLPVVLKNIPWNIKTTPTKLSFSAKQITSLFNSRTSTQLLQVLQKVSPICVKGRLEQIQSTIDYSHNTASIYTGTLIPPFSHLVSKLGCTYADSCSPLTPQQDYNCELLLQRCLPHYSTTWDIFFHTTRMLSPPWCDKNLPRIALQGEVFSYTAYSVPEAPFLAYSCDVNVAKRLLEGESAVRLNPFVRTQENYFWNATKLLSCSLITRQNAENYAFIIDVPQPVQTIAHAHFKKTPLPQAEKTDLYIKTTAQFKGIAAYVYALFQRTNLAHTTALISHKLFYLHAALSTSNAKPQHTALIAHIDQFLKKADNAPQLQQELEALQQTPSPYASNELINESLTLLAQYNDPSLDFLLSNNHFKSLQHSQCLYYLDYCIQQWPEIMAVSKIPEHILAASVLQRTFSPYEPFVSHLQEIRLTVQAFCQQRLLDVSPGGDDVFWRLLTPHEILSLTPEGQHNQVTLRIRKHEQCLSESTPSLKALVINRDSIRNAKVIPEYIEELCTIALTANIPILLS